MSPTNQHDIQSPYKGLMPYLEEDAAFFYGREGEREIITANLMAYKLTLLYGASGVGKSSVLHAGIAHHLRQLTLANLAKRRTPEHAVVVFSAWRDDPLPGLINCVHETTMQILGSESPTPALSRRSLVETLRECSARTGSEVIVILDQFEEYFLYHPLEDGTGTFAREFPAAVNQPGLRASFLIAVRDDALAKLDRFKGRIPNLFDNYLRIDHLDYEMARDAIEKPILEYNRLYASNGDAVTITPALVEAVLDQVKTGRLVLSESGRGVVTAKSATKAGMRIETPYLQLVMSRLWEAERLAGSRVLQLDTLERLGGAERIVRTHLDTALASLTPSEAEAAARVFRYLVTPTGTKIAHTVPDLAEFAQLSLEQLRLLLHKLSSSGLRILRPVAPPAERPEAPYYEVFHDVLAPAILSWRSRYVQGQELAQEKYRAEKQQRRAEEKAKTAVRLRRLVFALAMVLALAGVAGAMAWIQWRRAIAAQRAAERERNMAVQQARIADSLRIAQLAAVDTAEARRVQAERAHEAAAFSRSRELAAEANKYLTQDPELSILLALHAAAATYSIDESLTPEVYDALNRAMQASCIRSVLSGHKNAVQDLAFDSDGARLASASLDGTAIVWNVSTGRKILTLSGHKAAIYGVAFSPDGKHLATAHVDGKAVIHDLASGRVMLTLAGHAVAVHDLAFSPDGLRLLTVDAEGRAAVWEVSSGRAVQNLPSHATAVNNVAFSPDRKRLAIADREGKVKVWDFNSGKELRTFNGHTAAVHGLAFSPDGALLATAGADQSTKLWNVSSGQETLTLKGHTSPVNRVAFSPDGKLLATAGSNGDLNVWDLASKQEHAILPGHSSGVIGLAFSPDGRHLASAGTDRKVKIWDVSPGQELLVLSHAAGVNDISYSPDRTRVATASADGKATVWSATSGAELLTLSGHSEAVNCIAFSLDGQLLATGSDDNTAQVWDAVTGRRIARLSHEGDVKSVAFGPNGRFLATACFDKSARIWDITTGHHVAFTGHTHWVQAAVFNFDGTRLASASSDRTARVWEISSGRELLILSGHKGALNDLEFSPDDRRIVTASADGTVKVWDAASGRQVLTFVGHDAEIKDVDYSPDGTRIATAAADGSVKLWATASGNPLLTLHSHHAVVNAVDFSPESKHLATASSDKTARVHALIAEDLITLARARVTRALTAEECRKFLYAEKCPPTPF